MNKQLQGIETPSHACTVEIAPQWKENEIYFILSWDSALQK